MSDEDLDDIFVDDDHIDSGLIAEVVGTYGKVTQPSGELLPNDEYHDLGESEKVLVGLLVHQAKYLRDIVDEPRVGPSGLSSLTGVNLNTVKGALRRFETNGIVTSDDGKYQIPTVQIEQVKQKLEGED